MNVRPVGVDDDPWLTELQLWAVSMGASSWVIDIDPYEACRVAGHVTRLVIDPLRDRIEVTVTDGTGELTAGWAIERPAPQLVLGPGRRVLLEGLSLIDHEGNAHLEQPDFRVVSPAGAEGSLS